MTIPMIILLVVVGRLPAAPAQCTLENTAFRAIGTTEGSASYDLMEVSSAALLTNGSLAVVNRGTKEVRLYDRNGTFVTNVGRRGEGPGEYQDPVELDVLGSDSIIVWDWGLQRLSVFTADGTFRRSAQLNPAMSNAAGEFGVLGGPATLLMVQDDMRPFTGKEFVPQYLRLLQYGTNGRLLDTVATVRNGSRGWVDESVRMFGTPAFQPLPVFDVSGGRLFIADGSRAEVRVWDSRTRQFRVAAAWADEDRAVTDADIAAWKESRLANTSGSFRRLMRKSVETVPIGKQLPALDRLRVDETKGTMFVRRFQRPSSDISEWLVFSADGKPVCSTTLPRRTALLGARSDVLILVSFDEDDVESIRLARLAVNR